MATEAIKPMPTPSVARPVAGYAASDAVRPAQAPKATDSNPAVEPKAAAPVPDSEQPENDASTAKALDSAVADLAKYVQSVRRGLEFSRDEESGRTVITVLNAETKEVIRQIPSEEVLAIARFIRERQSDDEPVGLLVKTKA
jgi:flagellar protein FlaG